MLTAREAFKVGFLARCVEHNLSPEQTLAMAKTALDKLADLSSLLTNAVLPAAVAAPWVAGGLGGYGLAKMTDIDPSDVAAIKDREVINAYQTETDKLRRRQQLRTMAQRLVKRPRP